MVLNGSEIGGGSVRIHREEMQSTVFEMLGISAEEGAEEIRLPARGAQVRRAAARRDRLRRSIASSMLMAGADSIRDVIAFPKTQTATCLLTDARRRKYRTRSCVNCISACSCHSNPEWATWRR